LRTGPGDNAAMILSAVATGVGPGNDDVFSALDLH
jgi:hypothetical protein